MTTVGMAFVALAASMFMAGWACAYRNEKPILWVIVGASYICGAFVSAWGPWCNG